MCELVAIGFLLGAAVGVFRQRVEIQGLVTLCRATIAKALRGEATAEEILRET